MLCPEDEDIQRDIFLYKYYQWNHNKSLNDSSSEKDYDNQAVISFLFSCLKNSKYNIADEIRSRLSAVYGAGKLLRLIHAIKISNAKTSPTIENAIRTYQRVIKSHKIEDEYYSRQYLLDFCKYKKDVWHLCAAFTLINPMKRCSDKFENRIMYFLSLAKYYRIFGIKTKKLRSKSELSETLIDPEKVFNIPAIYQLSKLSAADIGIGDHENIVLG